VLFVGHDASRTGAPVVGLAFVRWLATQGTADVGVALLGPGPLEPHYRRAAPTTVAAPRPWAVDALARAVADYRGEAVESAPDPVVCHCMGIKKSAILDVIEHGVDDLDVIREKTGAMGGACEGERCRPVIQEMIRDFFGGEA